MSVFTVVLMMAASGSEGCTARTLELEVTDYLSFGSVIEQALEHCATVNIPNMPRVPGRSYTLGRAKLFRFRLLGEEFGLNLNLVTQPVDGISPFTGVLANGFGTNTGGTGEDRIFVVPSLVLPPSWEKTLNKTVDRVAAPVAIVGGVAITTAVLVNILKK
ncbi:MAG: hypothetical protein AAFX94_09955 [Myxococcota bacterium]